MVKILLRGAGIAFWGQFLRNCHDRLKNERVAISPQKYHIGIMELTETPGYGAEPGRGFLLNGWATFAKQ